MNWCDERYVRLYTRDTADFLALSFEAQAVLALVLRKLDRAGVLELGKHGKRGVAIAIGHAARWPTIEPALEELLVDGCLVLDGNRLVMPNFLEAQEAVQSDRMRQSESRARRRELANTQVTKRDVESQDVTESHARSHAVTDGHAASQTVTPCCAVPSLPSLNTCQAAPDAPLLRLVDSEPTRAPDIARQQATSWLEWFNRKFQRQFRVTDEVVRMVKALNARGYRERPDMRGVALFLRDEWQDDPKMAKFLKPDSILVASKFGIRLDEAKERYPEIWAERVDGEEGGNAA